MPQVKKFSLVWLILLLMIHFYFSCYSISVFAMEEIVVKKYYSPHQLKQGGNITIYMLFYNPFNTSVKIQIKDKNVIANNGIDLQCFEYVLPPGNVTLAYEPISLYTSGNFTLDSALVSYIDPITGKQVDVKSNSLNVTVLPGNIKGHMEGITTIYKCNGQFIQTHSFSSSNVQMQFNYQTYSQTGSNQVRYGNNKRTNGIFNNLAKSFNNMISQQLSNNKLSQDAYNLKKQIQSQIQEHSQKIQEFQKALAKNGQFQSLHKELTSQGYKLMDAKFNPVSNNTGSFNLMYSKNNTQLTLSGMLNNGKLVNLSKTVGFYNKSTTGDNTYNSNSSFNSDKNLKKKRHFNFMSLILFFIVIIILGIIFYYYLNRPLESTSSDQENSKSDEHKKRINHRAVALSMLRRAKKIFDRDYKEAYYLVARALRFYFINKFRLDKEITNLELLNFFKENNLDSKNLGIAIDMLNQVQYAKYKPNLEEFELLLDIAEGLIKNN